MNGDIFENDQTEGTQSLEEIEQELSLWGEFRIAHTYDNVLYVEKIKKTLVLAIMFSILGTAGILFRKALFLFLDEKLSSGFADGKLRTVLFGSFLGISILLLAEGLFLLIKLISTKRIQKDLTYIKSLQSILVRGKMQLLQQANGGTEDTPNILDGISYRVTSLQLYTFKTEKLQRKNKVRIIAIWAVRAALLLLLVALAVIPVFC